jgi:hypothetical protein
MWTLPGLLPGGIRRRAENIWGLVGLRALPHQPVAGAGSPVVEMVHKVRYRGNPSSVAVLDSLIRAEGLRVQHRQIVEQHGAQQDIVDIVLYVDDPDDDGAIGTSSAAPIPTRIQTAIAKLRTSVPRAQVELVAAHTRSPNLSLRA